jgi:hypothetical protein
MGTFEKNHTVLFGQDGTVIALLPHQRGGKITYAYDTTTDLFTGVTLLVNTRKGRASNSAQAWRAWAKVGHQTGTATIIGAGRAVVK